MSATSAACPNQEEEETIRKYLLTVWHVSVIREHGNFNDVVCAGSILLLLLTSFDSVILTCKY